MKNIGFGCVRLTSNFTEKQAITNLEVAFDHGISHFDVARLYGYGLAETMLGKFAAGKRDKITITTKFGLFPNNVILKNLFLQNILRLLFNTAKKLTSGKAIQALGENTVSRRLSVKDAQNSLETSLRELKTEYIDYLLIHEASIYEANNAELITFLEIQKNRGVIREYGVGSFQNTIMNNFSSLSKKYTVLQTDNSFPNTLQNDFSLATGHIKKRFYFSPLRNLEKVKRLFKDEPIFMRFVSDKLGFDAEESILNLFLMQQVHSDPNGTFLFTSSKNRKIKETINRWNYVQSTSAEQHKVFEEVRGIVKEKLIQLEK